jgi:flavin-dependent dehydrogenase
MRDTTTQYDVTIIGGGLAGLALSIQLITKGYSVALFEKEQYPFHKVCGEYISMESWGFIESLGVPLSQMKLPLIKKLMVSAPNGNTLQQQLPLGGFGISRFTLDNTLKNIAVDKGVQIYENCKVDEVIFTEDVFTVTTASGSFTSKVCCGSFGKRSNLDIKWKRSFVMQRKKKLNNYIGVKYHIKTAFATDTIALHNFKDGYCGISKIEGNNYCLCYLTNAANLKNNNNSIPEMEKNILFKNPLLQNIFENSEIQYKAPLVISQISFAKKNASTKPYFIIGRCCGHDSPIVWQRNEHGNAQQ